MFKRLITIVATDLLKQRLCSVIDVMTTLNLFWVLMFSLTFLIPLKISYKRRRSVIILIRINQLFYSDCNKPPSIECVFH